MALSINTPSAVTRDTKSHRANFPASPAVSMDSKPDAFATIPISTAPGACPGRCVKGQFRGPLTCTSCGKQLRR